MRFLTNKDVIKEEYDVVIIGGGIAGLFLALELPEELRVALLTKDTVEVCNSVLAQGGIAVSLGDYDTPESHFEDTMKAGAGLCDEDAVRTLVTEARDCIYTLCEKYNVAFDMDGKGKIALSREAAHSCPRIIHSKDKTGHDVCATLLKNVNKRKNIDVFERTVAIELLKKEDRCVGVEAVKRDVSEKGKANKGSNTNEPADVVRNLQEATIGHDVYLGKNVGNDEVQTGTVIEFSAGAVVCATGGYGQLFKQTSNPVVTTGDGVVMAKRIGAEIENMEFVQFHPTALLGYKDECRFLISEALRGEGAILRNINGERFMPKYHKDAELAARDIVSRAINAEMNATNSDYVYLDITFLDPNWLPQRFPTIYKECLKNGIDITKDFIPVAPIAHFSMGGIRVDINGQTTIPGLMACGEASCTGVHGANRLASNSLLEGLVFGRRIARSIERSIVEFVNIAKNNSANLENGERFAVKSSENLVGPGWTLEECQKLRRVIKAIMMKKVGIVRDAEHMNEADFEMHNYKVNFERGVLRDERGEIVYTSLKEIEVMNMLELSRIVIKAALNRKENRGGHYRSDCVTEK